MTTLRWDARGQFEPLVYLSEDHVTGTWTFVCHVCGAPANRLPVRSRHTITESRVGPLPETHMGPLDDKVSKVLDVTVYCCSDHYEQVSNDVADEWGWATNADDRIEPVFRPDA